MPGRRVSTYPADDGPARAAQPVVTHRGPGSAAGTPARRALARHGAVVPRVGMAGRWRATARWPGPRGGTSDAAAGRTMARASGPPGAPGWGTNRAPVRPFSDRQSHRSTNVCSNQDGFPSRAYVCSNNLHVSGKVWPLAPIRCYLLVPSERPQRSFRNGRPPRDLPQPSGRRGSVARPRWGGGAPGCGSDSALACSSGTAPARRPGSPDRMGRHGWSRSPTFKILTGPPQHAPDTSRR
jgi:hypothetical protein